MSARVLIVDDEPSIVELVKFNLEKEGFTCTGAYDGESALETVRREKPDLVILDVMLPKKDGFEICKILRQETQIPIIMLTAKDTEVDKILGLELGADDYITKPFSPRELVARVRAVLRRLGKGAGDSGYSNYLQVGDLTLDEARHEASVGGRKLDLTPKEFELLRLLMSNRGRVMTRDFLLETLWGYEYYGDTRTVDVHIRRLRQKLGDDPAMPRYIETVHGVGYKIKEAT
ncbi:MAG TPA: response regulator transcription factor [Firmicutes bacterium]|nr:response regulator transcription factor [Bacillota bacterium]